MPDQSFCCSDPLWLSLSKAIWSNLIFFFFVFCSSLSTIHVFFSFFLSQNIWGKEKRKQLLFILVKPMSQGGFTWIRQYWRTVKLCAVCDLPPVWPYSDRCPVLKPDPNRNQHVLIAPEYSQDIESQAVRSFHEFKLWVLLISRSYSTGHPQLQEWAL